MRSSVQLGENVTIADIRSIVDSIHELKFILSILFPGGDHTVVYRDRGDGDPAEKLVIHAEGIIKDGDLKHEVHLGFSNTRNWQDSTIVEIDGNYTFYENDEVLIANQHYEFTLLGLLEALFGKTQYSGCQFTKHGLETRINGIVSDSDALRCLFNPIYVDEDVTLGDVFKFVENNEVLKNFIGNYSWCWQIDDFHKQAKEVCENPREDKLWNFVINRSIDFHDKEELSDWICYSPDFGAIGDLSAEEQKWLIEGKRPKSEWPNHTNYGVGMSHMGELVDLPFTLDEDLVFTWYDKDYKQKKSKKVRMWYTFLDFLDSIYWEISFYGGPDQSQGLKAEIIDEIKTIKEALARGEDAGLVPFEDLLKEEYE